MMSNLKFIRILSFIFALVITGQVNAHQYPAQSIPTFPYTKFSQKPKVVRKITGQVPKMHDLKVDKIVPSITLITETQNHKLREFDLLPSLNLNFLRVPAAIICYSNGHICLSEITGPPLLSPIISPIADPFNDNIYKYMSLEEFYSWWRSWWRIYR